MTGEPSQVLLRMYGQLLDKNDTKITDSVITMLLSERNLGPKLYGIFPGGRLEEYIPVSDQLYTTLLTSFPCLCRILSLNFSLYLYRRRMWLVFLMLLQLQSCL